MHVVGLDIGTTTICAVVLQEDSGKLLHSSTVINDTAQQGAAWERLQSPNAIVHKCEELLQMLLQQYAPVSCIGISGQMHGMLYLNQRGEAVSPLYSWQDESANEPYDTTKSFAQKLTDITGHPMASGYGAATYYTHSLLKVVPQDAVCFCTVHDFVAMRLCGQTKPLTHSSDAASFGLYLNTETKFDTSALQRAGLDATFFPQVTQDFTVFGSYQNVPVAVAIGDNQASFIGSVRDMEETVLVNVGTGSQLSFATKTAEPYPGTQLRPLVNGSFLRVGASLCGGRAFAALESFLRGTAQFITGKEVESAYPAIDRYLAESDAPGNPLRVNTQFSGTRENPLNRGSVLHLDLENFTPQHLTWGVLQGIVSELALFYPAGESHSTLVGSGNGLRKNEALCRLFVRQFGKKLLMPVHTEEAAFGAALFAMTAAGRAASLEQAQTRITYVEI